MAAATGYAIRRARPAELGQLPAIEHAAAAQFRTTAFAALADAPLSTEDLDPAHDHIWVAVDSTDAPVGFALVHRLATVAHLHEFGCPSGTCAARPRRAVDRDGCGLGQRGRVTGDYAHDVPGHSVEWPVLCPDRFPPAGRWRVERRIAGDQRG